MQSAAKALTIRFTRHELTGMPGQPNIHPARDFAAFAEPPDASYVLKDAYCLGGGPNGSNGMRYFWMQPAVANAFESARRAAITDNWVVNVLEQP